MNNLKPCPFCGGFALMHRCAELENETLAVILTDKVAVHCSNCGVASLPCESEKAAKDFWNRRTSV